MNCWTQYVKRGFFCVWKKSNKGHSVFSRPLLLSFRPCRTFFKLYSVFEMKSLLEFGNVSLKQQCHNRKIFFFFFFFIALLIVVPKSNIWSCWFLFYLRLPIRMPQFLCSIELFGTVSTIKHISFLAVLCVCKKKRRKSSCRCFPIFNDKDT